MIRFSTPLIPFINRSSKARGESRLGPRYDALVQQLHSQAGAVDAGCVIGVTSCRNGEGVSTITRNLAVASARFRGLKSLLVDFSGSPSQLTSEFDFDQRSVSGDTIVSERPLLECVRQTSIEKLSLLSPETDDLSLSAFDKPATQEVLGELKRQFELIIVDMPHADELSTCSTMAAAMDGVVLVVEHGGVCGAEAQRAKKRLLQVGANLLGVVVNKETL